MRGALLPIPRSRPRRPILAAISALLLLSSTLAAAFPAARPCAERPDCLCSASRAECMCPPDASCGCNASVNDRPVVDAVPSAGFAGPFAAAPPALPAPPAARAALLARSPAVPAPFPSPDTPPPEA